MFLEIVFASVLVISCIGFLLFLRNTSRQQTQPKVKRKRGRPPKKKEQKNDEEIPEEWRKDNPGPAKSFKPSLPRKKIKVPGLRFTKRVIAGILLIINFFISQASLMSHQNTQPLFLLFFLNAMFLVDYLWKTRRKET